MTHSEVGSEIERLKVALRKIRDDIADAERELPVCRRDDERERRELHRHGPVGDAIKYADLQRESRMNLRIRELRAHRDEVQSRLDALRARARSQPDGPRMTGVVKWYDEAKGFGFLSVDGQPDVFVPRSSLMESRSLEEGDRVTFVRTQGPKGFRAVDVRFVPA